MSLRQRRRRRVEIYFVLYIAALVLLLPERNEPMGLSNWVQDQGIGSFQLQPEKTTLTCRFVRDSGGTWRIAERDTAVLIRYNGDVTDVSYEFRIEDQRSHQVLSISTGAAAPTQMFTVSANEDLHAADFRWQPDRSDITSKTFLVRVIATATPVVPTSGANSSDAAVATNIRLRAETQFMVTQVVDDAEAPRTIYVITQGTAQAQLDSTRLSTTAAAAGEFWLQSQQQRIVELSGRRWTNRVAVGGADPTLDLARPAAVRIDGDQRAAATVSVELDRARRELVVSGVTQATGALSVTVDAVRRDGKSATTSFTVQAEPLPAAVAPDVVYPGLRYVIKTGLPTLSDADVAAVIVENGRVVQRTSDDELVVEPQIGDTGSVWVFERRINGQPVGSSKTIRVSSFPAPLIVNVAAGERGGKPYRRITVMYHGSSNRPSLEVVDGNAQKPRTQFGNHRPADPKERPTVRYYEEFDVFPASSDRPFTFRVRATDARGFTSAVRAIE
jgi:hypothetical protein